MTTPAFNPIGTLLNAVRLYTQFDPYYYTVDNRPLGDLSNNINTLTSGIDGARRAELISSFNTSLELTCEQGVSSNFQFGLTPTRIDPSHVKIGVGGILIPLSVNSSISQVILKKAILQLENTLALQSLPTTVGTSKAYIVEGQYSDISATSPAETYFFDAGNPSLFDTCIDGLLSLQINSGGVEFTTGVPEVLPAVTAGWIPLYCIVVRQTGEWDKVYAHTNSPSLLKGQGLREDLHFRLPVTNPAVTSIDLEPFSAFQFTEGVESSVVATIDVSGKELNRFKDISISISYTSATAEGNFAVIASYGIINTSGIVTPISLIANAVEAVTGPSPAYSLTNATLSGKVPGSLLQGAKQIVIKLTRVGTNGTVDTSSGSLLLLGASITQ